MSHHTTEPFLGEQKPALTWLDTLLTELGRPTEAQCELLREHLESARTYLLGGMPVEYGLSLQMAGEALNCVTDDNLRDRICDFIKTQRPAR